MAQQSKRQHYSNLLETASMLSLQDISFDFAEEATTYPNNSDDDDLLPSTVIIPSKNYDRSPKELRITQEKSKEILLSHKGTGYSVQGYIKTPLDPLKNYIIRVQFLHNQLNNLPNFIVGLINNNQKDIECVGCFNLNYKEQSGGDMTTIVRGQTHLHSGKTNIGRDKMIELRINLSRQYMRAAAYPEYDTVVKINKSANIMHNEQYYLAFHIMFAPDEIRIMDYFTVSEFDQNMQ